MAILIQFNWPKMDHKKGSNFVKISFMKITHYTDICINTRNSITEGTRKECNNTHIH